MAACGVADPEQRHHNMHLPSLGFKGDRLLGEALFQSNCKACHGAVGQGSPQGHL